MDLNNTSHRGRHCCRLLEPTLQCC